MSTQLGLASVLKHQNLRSTTVIELETPIGALRLDLPGGQESVNPPNDPERTRRASEILKRAREQMDGDRFEEADHLLEEATRITPLLPEAYRIWLGISFQRQDTARIEYAFKQLFALERTPFDLLQFAVFLGRAGRLDESLVVFDALWNSRNELKSDFAREVTEAYLVTLHRAKQAGKLVEVAETSIQSWGENPAFLYQALLGHLMLGELDYVERALPKARTLVPEDSPLHQRFQQMAEAVTRLKGRP